jgi:hypothetical protein
MDSKIETTSTSAWTADVSPVVMRESGQTRLVFLPEIVRNAANPDAGVKGILCYQRKTRLGAWEAYEAINLANLKAGEGVRLDLRSGEVLALYDGLTNRYAIAREHGIQSGTRTFVQAPQSEQLRALLTSGSLDDLLCQDDTGLVEGFLAWFARQQTSDLAERLATVQNAQLVSFDAAIGAARLKSFLYEYESNSSRPDEDYWQDLLERHSWVISQVYAYPFVIIRGQAYVGGKRIDNRGGNVVDFLYANAITDNAALVEIKTPATPLLESKEYRNNTYNVFKELSGATQQLLVAKNSLVEDYRSLASDNPPVFRPFSPKALLIIGDTRSFPNATAARRSFELYRNNLREIDVITFDELAEKIRRLIELLESA